jgi:hypothetical protein
MKNNIKNYGLNWELEKQQQSVEDWVFGAKPLICIAENIPPLEREECLPKGECQNIGDEKMDCATRGPLNLLETKFNWLIKNKKISAENIKFFQDNGYIKNGKVEFSDRFNAILSGTTNEGNSLKAPLDSMRTHSDPKDNIGIIPKSMLPQVFNFNEYYDKSKITDEMRELGKEFLERFTINYEKVYENQMPELLEKDMLDVAGYAWPDPENGEYPRVDYQPNHCFMGVRKPMTYIFDNYIDYVDGDFVKKLAENYNFMDYGYRITITEKKKEETKKSFWSKLWEAIINFLKAPFK